ncbi:MAG: 4a-hydroxytetrahydrobiopterin dehydratase [Candidatus Omnitrophota bacterium]
MELKDQKCAPCQGNIPKMEKQRIAEFLQKIVGWDERDEKIHKRFLFNDFIEAMKFVNRMSDLAEDAGHHPDFCVHYNQVDVTVWTHKIGGLSVSDFILAAKIDALPR